MSAGKYWGGNYDGDFGTKVKQAWSDCLEAMQIEKEAKQHQKDVKENEAKRILGKEEVTDEDILKLFQAYTKDDRKRQYLVSGALLTCNQATWDPFPVPGQDDIVLDAGQYARKDLAPVGKLVVHDDTMSVNNELYATVKDAVINKNIFPFQCNCKKAADRAGEIEAIKNDPSCKKDGVCKHLMKLNDEWENLPLTGQFYKTKRLKTDKPITSGRVQEIECITMTSMLFCRHGGLITPVTSGQRITVEEGVEFTKEELIACGWSHIDDSEVNTFNKALKAYGVTSKESALVLVATMLSESGCINISENASGKTQMKKDEWENYKRNLASKGINVEYEWEERGAGYIQITWKDTHMEFLATIPEKEKEDFDGYDTAGYIGQNFPIEASVWYWTNFQKTGKGNLNAYVEEYGASENIFLVTQYFVNSYKEGIDPYLGEIRKGAKFEINGDTLEIGDGRFEVPEGWEKREKYWKNVEQLLP